MNNRVAILEDDKELTISYKELFSAEGYSVLVCHNSEQFFSKVKAFNPDLVILDIILKFSSLSGLDVLEALNQKKVVDCPVIVTSGNASLTEVARAMTLGAFNFIEKGAELNFDKLLVEVDHAIKVSKQEKRILSLEIENISLKKKISSKYKIIGSSRAVAKIKHQVNTLSKTNVDVLVYGETGTGKEIIAHNLYSRSNRCNGPYNKVNCSAITPSLIESELFGYKKGAFTGAISDKIGWFEKSNGGLLFLDEFNSLSLELQAKILRTIENREIQIVGGPVKKIDVRLIFATNEPLDVLVSQRKLRKDLYYRIEGNAIYLPPLVNREYDIEYFIEYFLYDYATDYLRKVNIEPLLIRDELLSYGWPGNIRELRNLCHQICIFEDEITNDTILEYINQKKQNKQPDKFQVNLQNIFEVRDFSKCMSGIEKKFLEFYLRKNNWSVTATANSIGLERTTVYKKMKKLGIRKK